MRIFKDVDDLTSIAKEIIRIMAQKDIFAEDPSSEPKGYPIVETRKKHVLRFKFVNGFIFFPKSWTKNYCLRFTQRIAKKVEELERGLPHDYMDFEVCSRREPITSIKSKNYFTRIGIEPPKNSIKDFRVVFKWKHEVDPSKFPGARMTWYLSNIDKFHFNINPHQREYHLTANLASLFLDFENTSVLAHDTFSMELKKEHFSLHETSGGICLGAIFKSENPLLIILSPTANEKVNLGIKLRIKENLHPSIKDTAYFYMLGNKPAIRFNENTIALLGKTKCQSCRAEAYGKMYASLLRAQVFADSFHEIFVGPFVSCTLLCGLCIRSEENKKFHSKAYRVFEVQFPKTQMEVIEELKCSKEVKKIYKMIAQGDIAFSQFAYEGTLYDSVHIGNYIAVDPMIYEKIIMGKNYLGFNRKIIQCRLVRPS